MVIVLDKHKKPVGFMKEKHARKLMEQKRACIYRFFPTVIILMDKDVRDMENLPTYRIKIDPGSKHTGIAFVCNETNEVMFYEQIEHRADDIVSKMQTRKQARHNRRNRETPYRRCKYKDGDTFKSERGKGKLPPSIKSIGDNIINHIKKMKRFVNITDVSFEAVRFDTQLLDNPDREGIEYQQGEMYGYELREYLLDKYQHTCQYCGGVSKDPVLEREHILPKSRGGSDKLKNATLSCSCCNREKNNLTPEEWLKKIKSANAGIPEDELSDLTKARINGIQNVIKHKITGGSNKYCAWVSSTRKYVEEFLYETFGEEHVECSSGGRTKYNRINILNLPKDHHYDALSVGNIPDGGYKDKTNGYCLYIKATGRGNRLRGLVNACGVIVTKWTDRAKTYNGLKTGDIVRVEIPSGKYKGAYIGRIMIRKSGHHDVKPLGWTKRVTGTKQSTYKVLQAADGYSYCYKKGTGV